MACSVQIEQSTWIDLTSVDLTMALWGWVTLRGSADNKH